MTGAGARGVVLLHGHGRLGASLFRIARALRREGHAAWAPGYPYRRSLADILAVLEPRIAEFADRIGGPVHLVGHSLGGLVARALAARLPDRVGRIVMLGPPNGGSEWADLLVRLRLDRALLGRSAAHLTTMRAEVDEAMLAGGGHATGIIAGDLALDPLLPRLVLPRPNDGKVSVAATRLRGAADHIVLPVSHTLMVYDARVVRQVLAFLARGRFDR